MTQPPSRDAILDRLLDPDFYPHNVEHIQKISTHISDVFLTGSYAYKLKRPVDFGFLDFTTLEARHHYCQEELRLNRRLAPQLYLDVLPITREEDGSLALNGGGKPVDYLVKMVQFPSSGLFDQLLLKERVTPALMERLGEMVAHFHRQAEQAPDPEAFGGLAAVRAPVEQNFEQIAPLKGVTIDPEQWKHLHNWSETVLTSHAGAFRQRVADQHIRACHGDLHLRNICLYEEQPLVFDCIEFNDQFRFSDTVSDWAFLAMDLDYRGRPDLGNRFLNSYLQESDDYHGLLLAPFYLVYRAMVRGKIAGFMLEGSEGEARQRTIDEARGYFALAEHYTRSHRAGLVIMCGLSGSGKSLAASQLAEQIHGVVIRSDAVRKHIAGMPPRQRSDAGLREGIYSGQMSARTYLGLLERAELVRQAGYWAILDATYLRVEHRAAAVAWARERHLPVHIVHTDCPDNVLAGYLAQREAEGADISEANGMVVESQRQAFQPPTAGEADGVHRVDSSGPLDLQPVVRAIAGQ